MNHTDGSIADEKVEIFSVMEIKTSIEAWCKIT